VALAVIYELPRGKDDWPFWSFCHAANHYDIVRVVFEKASVELSTFLLDPMDPDNMDQWLYWHQTMHNQMNAVLQIQGNDLLNLDWRDPGDFQEWITFNGNEHYQACQILGLG